ncbi:MAG: response regulator [Anaerolineales bacterium]|nr:response regulator [Anaerolineales bacterium]
MLYKVFLVEDEVVAREGIRDNVDWRRAGFEFCGEAPDGEVALPLIEAAQPDVLITDIKMPFMDGLQLSQLVRERLPATKIVILSGHDEFQYAQQAIKLGVTEYLLKPIGARELHALLERIAQQLAKEHQDQAQLRHLQEQAHLNQALLRQRFLLRLICEDTPLLDALAESRRLELDVVASAYLVAVARVDSPLDTQHTEAAAVGGALDTIAAALRDVHRIFVIRKDLDELVLLFLGDQAESVATTAHQVVAQLNMAASDEGFPTLKIAVGAPQQRISDLHRSYANLITQLQYNLPNNGRPLGPPVSSSAELLGINRSALEDYLKFGDEEGFDTAWRGFLGADDAIFTTDLHHLYLYLDVVLTAARFVHQLGGDSLQLLPELYATGFTHDPTGSYEQLKIFAQQLYRRVIAWRDHQATNRHVAVVQRATEYIDLHYTDPALSLSEVATHVHLSPSHFSNVFSNETGETFKEYLTRVRIDRAKELLRTTALGSAEICFQVGYSDPHYFSVAFKRTTGQSPRSFRSPSEAGDELE